jgi:site-specific DNA-methyltransferase (adenine-specific)
MAEMINDGFEVVQVSTLREHPQNPRQGDVGAVIQSIEANGFYGAVVAQRSTRRVLAGNHRLRAAKQLGSAEIPVVWVDVDDDRAVRILLSDNRTSDLGTYDEAALSALLTGLAETADLVGTGYSAEDLDELLAGTESPFSEEAPEDDAPDVAQGEPESKQGEVYELGPHRLVCGDSTALTWPDGGCLVYDPPWDACQPPPPVSYASTLAFTDGQRAADVIRMFGPPVWVFAWDCVSSWYTPNRPLKRMKLCLWYGSIKDYDFDGSHYGDAGEVREVRNTRGTYTFRPDARGKHLSDVFQRPITAMHANEDHSHGKPVDWMRMLIANTSRGAVVDQYAGGGASIIAAAQLGRDWRGAEIEPRYCDVIRRRWTKWAKDNGQDPGTGALE